MAGMSEPSSANVFVKAGTAFTHHDDDNHNGRDDDHSRIGHGADHLGPGRGGALIVALQPLQTRLQRAGLLTGPDGLHKRGGKAHLPVAFEAVRHGAARAHLLRRLFQRAAELLVPGLGGHHLQTPQRGQARGEQNGELGTEHRQLLFPDAGIDGAGKRIALFFLYRLDFGDERAAVPQLGHRLKFVISPNDAGDLRPVKALAPVAISGHIRSLLSRLCFGFFNPPPCW